MFKTKSEIIVSLLLIIGISTFVSCQKEESISTKENLSIEEYNANILNDLKLEIDNASCLKSAGFNLIEILKTDEGKALFSIYCINLKIEIEGKEYIIKDYNPSLVNELYESTLVKLALFDGACLKSTQGLNKAAPTDAEIRDALKKECGKYMFGFDEICNLAVDIAYILR
ncbi:MAG: hypothetical protein JXC36_01170 [Candidatus Atribacteria bacterium]|nr:hypothetical protein [Candidatus Atribacteria bacterium]MBN2747255.1 hypothetical protein [Bacteroidales bacterium]